MFDLITTLTPAGTYFVALLAVYLAAGTWCLFKPSLLWSRITGVLQMSFLVYLTWILLVTTQYYNKVLTQVFNILNEHQSNIQMVLQYLSSK